MQEVTTYICDYCGEEITLPVDFSGGSHQEFSEDCPVCCQPNSISIEVDEQGDVRAWGRRESE